MDLPARVLAYCPVMNLSKHPATLVAIRPEGYFELRLTSQDGRQHLTLLPIAQTVLVFADAEVEVPLETAIER